MPKLVKDVPRHEYDPQTARQVRLQVLHLLHTHEPLSIGDLDNLERALTDNKIGKSEYIDQAKQENESFGIFVRTLVGLDREVAKGLFNDFLASTTFSANQIEFINLIINQLVDHWIVDVGLLYESPFTDISPPPAPTPFSPPNKSTAFCSCWRRSN